MSNKFWIVVSAMAIAADVFIIQSGATTIAWFYALLCAMWGLFIGLCVTDVVKS